jgi:hypothetical protein
MAKKIKKYKVGIDSETYAISLVESPAIESDFVHLAEQKEQKVFLESDEKYMVYGAALIPDKDIYRNNGEQEFYISFTKESIEKMSQDFMKEYRQHEVKTDHDEVANEVCVVESWLVEDSYKDKSNALGINVPEGTWMVGMKVNNIETWERVKSGELKGFSVESMLTLEEFSKIENNMDNTNEEMFLDKLRNVLKEFFSSKKEEPTEIEPTNIDLSKATIKEGVDDKGNEYVDINLQEAVEPQPEPQPTVEEPKVEEPADTKVSSASKDAVVEEPKPQEEPKVEEPKDNHLEELVNSLKDEIKALKDMNGSLQKKIKDLGKTPSAEPIKPNAKPSNGDTYTAWREQMRQMIG